MPFPIALAASLLSSGVNAIRQNNFLDSEGVINQNRTNTAANEEARLRGSIPQYSVGKTSREAYNAAMQDPAGDYMRQQNRRRGAEEMGALKSGGAKALLGGLGASQRRSQQALAEGEIGAFDRKQTARNTFAGLEQGAQDKNTANAAGLTFADLSRSIGNQQKLQEQSDGFRGLKQKNTAGVISAAGNFMGGIGADIQESGGGIGDYFGFEDGGIVEETPGEFSHERNPIDIIRAGRKIGEMTGGEAVLNPEQQETMEELASSGDSELHKFVRSMFEKFKK
jgi:hypothetical protein